MNLKTMRAGDLSDFITYYNPENRHARLSWRRGDLNPR